MQTPSKSRVQDFDAMGDSVPHPDAAGSPLFSFGVVADVQYADKDDGNSEGRWQRYREAPGKLAQAVSAFNSANQDLSFVLTLGDIIDGNETLETTRADFDVILKELSKLELPAVHLLGNHCLSLPRETVMAELTIPARYYQRDLGHKWSLVILDSMDMSSRWPDDTPNHKEATKFLDSHPLGDEHPQMSLWNGGIGDKQKIWLQGVLSNAERDGVKLIIAEHHPLMIGSAPVTHFLWNFKEVSLMLLQSSAVVLFLCGHYHPGGYACVNNKHFVTVEAILEAPTGIQAHGIVSVYNDKITIRGYGTVTSRELTIEGEKARQST